ncbi:MAG: MMPL family transporter [Gammaproteobacteria bacterium]|nr:MMPL family transporter [Gammaproteobacteria bacterium]MBT5223671.1 MMPL family transporter [Gammaproteobacteria bacterium]MBT5824587.1 MMPL family transporter [Gammaproteobacteria bacterium]MBT5967678.1 MMPL family transporter [Gammaproteobacteria bacterium]MBT6576420.1 MMPL family transporter [Gammaproteobacteria bacterium]
MVTRYAWLIIGMALLLTGLSIYYAKDHLGVNNNSSEMLSPDLPFQKNFKRLETAFPQDTNAILFVVDTPTPEETAIAASNLLKRLENNSDFFESSYIPDDNAFFRQQAFLYLSTAELDKLASNLTDAQPFIGYLAQNYHLQGLFSILTEALENEDSIISQSLPALLTSISTALEKAATGAYYHVSWQEILNPNSATNKTRRIVIAKPWVNYQSMMPVDAAIAKARSVSNQLMHEMPGSNIRITGDIALQHEELEDIGDGAVLSGIGSLLLVLAILFRCFRSIKLLLATLITLLIGLTLTAGFAAIAIGHLNVISVSFAALYIGLGVDFAIHMNLHYRAQLVKQQSNEDAIKKALHSVGFSLFLCALTTSIGFFAFVPTDYTGVSELGMISGVSMFIGLAVSMLVLPALLTLFKLKDAKPFNTAVQPSFIQTLPFRYKKTIRISTFVIAFSCLFVIPSISFDSNPIDMRNPKATTVIAFKDLLKSKTDSPYALYALSQNLEATRQLSVELELLPSVHGTINLESLVANDQDEKLYTIEDLALILGPQLSQFNARLAPSDTVAVLTEFNATLANFLEKQNSSINPKILLELSANIDKFLAALEQFPEPVILAQNLDNSILGLLPYTITMLSQGLSAYQFGINDIPEQIRLQWLSPTGIYRTMIMPEQNLNIPENLKQFAEQVQSIDPSAVGMPVGEQASGKAVVGAFQQAFASSLLIIGLLLLYILRSIKKMLLVIAPLLLAGLLTCTVNVFLGIPFNFANIIALPLLLGMGVDSGIHIMHCLHESLADDQNLLQTSTARGVMFSSITTMSSFISLAFIPHFGISSMGITLAVGISFTLLCTLIILPAFSSRTIQLEPKTQ